VMMHCINMMRCVITTSVGFYRDSDLVFAEADEIFHRLLHFFLVLFLEKPLF
jgi:hypothetical protein